MYASIVTKEHSRNYVFCFGIVVAYSLKHTRDLIRAISKKVKAPQAHHLLMGKGQGHGNQVAMPGGAAMLDQPQGGSRSFLINHSYKGSHASLPPIG